MGERGGEALRDRIAKCGRDDRDFLSGAGCRDRAFGAGDNQIDGETHELSRQLLETLFVAIGETLLNDLCRSQK